MAERRVGPVVTATPTGRGVAEAFLRCNPHARLDDRGGYLRVHGPPPCSVTRAEIEATLGEPFAFPSDLERVMPSFAGRFSYTPEAATWR